MISSLTASFEPSTTRKVLSNPFFQTYGLSRTQEALTKFRYLSFDTPNVFDIVMVARIASYVYLFLGEPCTRIHDFWLERLVDLSLSLVEHLTSCLYGTSLRVGCAFQYLSSSSIDPVPYSCSVNRGSSRAAVGHFLITSILVALWSPIVLLAYKAFNLEIVPFSPISSLNPSFFGVFSLLIFKLHYISLSF